MINELSKHVAVQLVRYTVRNISVYGELFTDQIKLRNARKELYVRVTVYLNRFLYNKTNYMHKFHNFILA